MAKELSLQAFQPGILFELWERKNTHYPLFDLLKERIYFPESEITACAFTALNFFAYYCLNIRQIFK